MKEKNRDLLEKYEAASQEVINLKEKIIELKNKIGAAQNDGLKLQNQIEQLRNEKHKLSEEMSNIKSAYFEKETKLLERIDEFENEAATITKEREELIRTLSKTKARLNRLEDSGKQSKDTTKADVYLAEIDRLMIEKESIKETVKKREEEIERLRKNLENQIHKMPGVKSSTPGRTVKDQDRGTSLDKKRARNFNIKDDEQFLRGE